MNINKITAIIFSPTDSTRNIVAKATKLLDLPTETIDITDFPKHEENHNSSEDVTANSGLHEFADDELAIFAVPVYGGRVPVPAIERIAKIHGNSTPCVLIATFGNREFDDALLELQNTVKENGFIAIAAVAFVTEHSIMHSVAQGRPDKSDDDIIKSFTQQLLDKIKHGNTADELSITVSGNVPYKEYNGIPLKPQTDKTCTGCGICAQKCPVGAISSDNCNVTDKDRCISCMRCIKVCPIGARKLNKLMLSVAEASFAKKCSARKEPTIFI